MWNFAAIPAFFQTYGRITEEKFAFAAAIAGQTSWGVVSFLIHCTGTFVWEKMNTDLSLLSCIYGFNDLLNVYYLHNTCLADRREKTSFLIQIH